MAARRAHRPISRGDVVLVPFPFTDLSATKLLPAIVVGAVPGGGADLTLAFIGTQATRSGALGEVAILPTHPEFGMTGLVATSTIRTEKLVTLSTTLLRRWLGRLGPLLLADLDRALVAGLGINTVPYVEEGRRQERARLAALHNAGGAAAVLSDLGVQGTAKPKR